MGVLEDLAASLVSNEAQRAIAGDNTYYNLKAVPDQLGGLVQSIATQAPGRFSTGDLTAGSLVTGLLSGLLGGAGDNYQTTLTNRYQDVVKNAISGTPSVEDGGLSSGLFKQANQSGQLFKFQRVLEQEQRKQGLEDAILKAGLTKQAEKEGELNAYGISASQSPDSPQYKIKQDLESKRFDLSKDFQGQQIFKEYQTVDKGYRSMLKAAADTQGASDLDLIYGAIQMIEPGMAVKEGEQAAVAQTASLPERFKGEMLRAMEGGAKLSPDVRKGIIDLATRRYDEHSRVFNTARDSYVNQAKRIGVPDPEGITYMPRAEDSTKLKTLSTPPPQSTSNLQGVLDKLKKGETLTTEDYGLIDKARSNLLAPTKSGAIGEF